MKLSSDVFIRNTLFEGTDFIIQDDFHKEYHFKIASFPIPTGLLSEALELTEDDSPGYTFNLVSSFDTDTEYAELLLKDKIKKGINKKYCSNIINKKLMSDKKFCGIIEPHSGKVDTKYHKLLIVDNTRVTI